MRYKASAPEVLPHMGQDLIVVGAWVAVAALSVSLVVVCARFWLEVCRLRRVDAYRVAAIVVSRTSLGDLEAADRAGGGDVCFLTVDRPPLSAGQDPCFVCCESGAVDVVGACGHGGMCAACFARVWAHPSATCPICRGRAPRLGV